MLAVHARFCGQRKCQIEVAISKVVGDRNIPPVDKRDAGAPIVEATHTALVPIVVARCTRRGTGLG